MQLICMQGKASVLGYFGKLKFHLKDLNYFLLST